MVWDIYGSLVLVEKVEEMRTTLGSDEPIEEEYALRIFALAVIVARSMPRRALRGPLRESIIAAYEHAATPEVDLIMHRAADELQ